MRDRLVVDSANRLGAVVGLTLCLGLVAASLAFGQEEPYREFKYEGASFHGPVGNRPRYCR